MGKELNKNLLAIQQELKAPKGQYNNFGKYKYRSCEELERAAVKRFGIGFLRLK